MNDREMRAAALEMALRTPACSYAAEVIKAAADYLRFIDGHPTDEMLASVGITRVNAT